jgi:hypothetical protein
LDAAAVGGGVLVRGTGSVITRTTIFGNEADYGGGVASWLNADATIVDSTLIENYGRFGGGAAVRSGSITFTRSTLADNSAISGGGIEVYSGESRFTNSTVSGNTASFRGGGILSYGTNHLTNSTLSGNSSIEGGGIFTFTDNYVTNTLFANSLQSGNCDGYVIDLGNNLADDDTCGTIPDTLTGLDPVLTDNGGPTPTHALLEGSNAIDLAGDCGLATDQRGAPRFDGACDGGAFELTPCPLLILSGITVDMTEEYEECDIQAGPDLLVTSTGDLVLRSGKGVAILDGFEVESGGGLTVEIDPDLQLTIAIEAARQAGARPR